MKSGNGMLVANLCAFLFLLVLSLDRAVAVWIEPNYVPSLAQDLNGYDPKLDPVPGQDLRPFGLNSGGVITVHGMFGSCSTCALTKIKQFVDLGSKSGMRLVVWIDATSEQKLELRKIVGKKATIANYTVEGATRLNAAFTPRLYLQGANGALLSIQQAKESFEDSLKRMQGVSHAK